MDLKRVALGCCAVLLGCVDSDSEGTSDDDGDLARLEEEWEFWEAVASCGDWAEYYPTVQAMADGADAAVFGRIADVAPGRTIQGAGSPDDFYSEVNLEIEVVETFRNAIAPTFELSQVLPGVEGPEDVEPKLAELREVLPRDPIVLLVRERGDIVDLYRVVNCYGLWAHTLRAPLDYPIDSCAWDSDEPNTFPQEFLGGIDTIDELVSALRP